MNLIKKTSESKKLDKIVRISASSGSRKQSADKTEKTISINSYLTPNNLGGKRLSAQQLQIQETKNSIFDLKKPSLQTNKKEVSELRNEFFSSAKFKPKKSTGNTASNCFNSTLTNLHLEMRGNSFSKGNFKKKQVRENTPKAKKEIQKNGSFSKEKNLIGILEPQKQVKSNITPINIFNIKNYTILANTSENKQKHSAGDLNDSLKLLRNKKSVFKNLKQLFQNNKSLNNQISNGFEKDNAKTNLNQISKNQETENQKPAFLNLEKLIGEITDLKIKKQEFSSQTSFQKYHQVNFSSTNINSLIKDIAKSKMLAKLAGSHADQTQPTDSKSMNGQIIKECVSMSQEQLFFEEMLLILGEKGVDVENLFAFCYERLKINTNASDNFQANASFKILNDSFSCLNSEVSVLENASTILCKKLKMSAKKRKLQLDMKNVKPEIFSSNDENI